MEESTLLFRHLPSELTQEERKDFLHHIGANQVRLMGVTGPMKNTAFVVFQNKEKAKEVLNQLHQTEFLGSTLVVEFARKQNDSIPSLVDNEGAPVVEKDDDDEKDEASDSAETRKRAASQLKFDSVFAAWGLNYPRRPELRYLYPPPTPSILTNIMHALAAVPKFYVQVLHLMNKMDLPAPFGMVTPNPPLNSVVHVSSVPDDISQKEMDISSSSESELSSSDEDKLRMDKEEKHQRAMLKTKRSHNKPQKSDYKKPKLSDLQDFDFSVPSNVPSISITDVFEKSNDSTPAKKIEMKLSGINPPRHYEDHTHHRQSLSQEMSTTFLYNPSEPTMPLPPPPLSRPDTTHLSGDFQQFPNLHTSSGYVDHTASFTGGLHQDIEKQCEKEDPDSVVVGFGIIEPQLKEPKQDEEEESIEKTWTKARFVSSSELRKSRLSSRDMKDLSVFKRYSSGEPSCRLYIKNLAKQVSEEDLHWVFGRYVDWESETETNIFDIRLMKEGRMKGQSFITLPNEEVAKSAVKDTNGFVFKDKPMVVQFARSAKAEEDKASKV